MRVFVDTSAILALLDEDDRHHGEARDILRSLPAAVELVTHNYVEVETVALVRRRLGARALERLTADVLPALTILWVDESLHRVALAAHRAAGSVSLVDQVSFEVMRREGITVAFAFDRDFKIRGFERPHQPGHGEGGRLSEVAAPYGQAASSAELVSVAEIAARTGRSVNTVQSWRRRHRDFPTPIASLATGPIWTWPDIEPWVATRPARRGTREESSVRA